MGIWLLAATLQLPPAPQAPPAEPVIRAPSFSIGIEGGGGGALGDEGGGFIAGGGIRTTIPLWGRDSLNLRALHAVPNLSGGLYEIRWQRHVRWPGPFQPDYAGVGAVGFYWMETGRYGRVKSSFGGITYPLMMSLTAGWDNARGRHLKVPFEMSVYIHPYGLLAASMTVGVTWSPGQSSR